jgi:hypothetical protein
MRTFWLGDRISHKCEVPTGSENVCWLSNPVYDSGAISKALKSAGFDIVELKRDLSVNEMRRALRDFSDKVAMPMRR